MNMMARHPAGGPHACVLCSGVPPRGSLRASGDHGDRCTLSRSLGEEGRRVQQGKFCQGASSLQMGPICGHQSTRVYSKGSFFPCKPESACHLPELAILPITHMAPGRVRLHPTALAGNSCWPCQPGASSPSLTFSQVSC